MIAWSPPGELPDHHSNLGDIRMDHQPSPASITQLPVMTSADAENVGFAIFNHVPTLPIDIPDGGFTVSAKTSEGLRVTFYFGPSRTGGPSVCRCAGAVCGPWCTASCPA